MTAAINTMTIDEASRLIGGQSRGNIERTQKALSIQPWLNTDEEKLRLYAATMVLDHWKTHCMIQQGLRDLRQKRKAS